jgi:hypothetical protein
MHTIVTWLELAARARSLADEMSDLTERTEMLDIAASYEQRAGEIASSQAPTRYLGTPLPTTW